MDNVKKLYFQNDLVKSKIENNEHILSKDDNDRKFEDHIKEETVLKTKYSPFEENRNYIAVQSYMEKCGTTKCKICNYSSDSAVFLKLHILSHDVHGTELFQKLPYYLTAHKFVSKEAFKEQLESYLLLTGPN